MKIETKDTDAEFFGIPHEVSGISWPFPTGGSDTLRGSESDEKIMGLGGDDWIYGEGGNDSLYGGGFPGLEPYIDAGSIGTGYDHLYGGAGDDGLNGGDGADELVGGSGADTFFFNRTQDSTPTVRDVIVDFNRAEGDKIDLSAIDAHAAWWKPFDQKFQVKQLSYSDGVLKANVYSTSDEFEVELTGSPELDLTQDIIY